MGRATFTVPGYLVDAPLGHGADSQVWLGRVAVSGDPVALKRIVLHGRGQAETARAEAALLAELDHPHLVRLHELVLDGEQAVLVLDLASGGSLRDLIEARGSLTPGEVITALAPIASVLAYLHDAGVVHGDVTPANILFTDDGQPMLADLGVARLSGDESTVRSTPAYIDPGVAAGFMPAPQSDVFMLGGVALHALTGRPLWPGATPEDALFAALAANLSDLDARLDAANVPGEMRAVLRRALAIEPARRGTAADFALDLRYSAEPTAVEFAAGRLPDARAAMPVPQPPELRGPAVERAAERMVEPAVEPAVEATVEATVEPAVAPAAWSADSRPPGPPVVDESDVPADSDLIDDAEPAGDPAQTYLVTPRPRPRRTPHHHRRRFGRGRWVAAAAAVLALGGGAAAWALIGNGGGSGNGTRTNANSPVPTVSAPVAAVDGAVETLAAPVTDQASSASGSAATPKTLSPADVLAVLQQLDALREQAFARRAPLLLTGVYAPGPLLDEDTATLERIVPSGCGLEGVQTTYSGVAIRSQDAGSVTVDVRAALAPSVLFCNGIAKAKAAGSPATTLHMTLSRSGSTFLISAVAP